MIAKLGGRDPTPRRGDFHRRGWGFSGGGGGHFPGGFYFLARRENPPFFAGGGAGFSIFWPVSGHFREMGGRRFFNFLLTKFQAQLSTKTRFICYVYISQD